VGALPRPKVPDGPIREFFDGLHDLHHRAGWPSLRDMAREVGCSHTTVSVAFSGASVPRWGLIELIVEVLGGDTGRFHELWLAASAATLTAGRPPAETTPAETTPAETTSPDTDLLPRRNEAAAPGEVTSASQAHLPMGLTPPPRQLPGDVAAFTGRRTQLAELDRLLAESTVDANAVVISAVSGTAGVGKTALAVHWGHRVAKAFPDGQLYLNLRGYDPDRPMQAAEALEVFLRTLGVEAAAIPHRLDERAARYRTLLADRKMLVLLDNAHSVDQVRDLLPGSPSCLVLVTSRGTLPGLVVRHGAVRINLDVLTREEAIALLRRLIGPRLDDEPERAAALVERCARLPLAIRIAAELAAARPSVPLSQLVDELGDESRRLDLLATGEDDYTTVRTVFSWSCRHLSDDALSAFQLLGLHPGRDIDLDAAAALLGVDRTATRRLLDLLCRAHLVEETGLGRFGMHDLLRAYAAEQAVRRDDRHAALTRLFDHYLHTAVRAVELARPHDPWLTIERANLIATAAAAVEVSPEHTVALSARLAHHLDTRAQYRDGLSLHRLALRAVRARHDRAGEGDALDRLGTAYMRTGSYPEAIDHHRRALAIHRELENRAGEGRARHGLGTVAWRLGHYDEAREHLEAALAIRRELGDVPGEGAALYGLGTVYRQVGDYREAMDHQRRALAIYRECGDRIGESRVLINLGATIERAGGYDEALDHYERALTINREIGNRLGEAVALTNLGAVIARLGRFAEGLVHQENALPLYREIGNRVGLADALHCLGVLHHKTGRYDEALDHLCRSVALAHEIGEADVENSALVDLGETLRAIGEDDDAAAAYRSALALAEQTGDRYERARALSGLGRLSSAAGDRDGARRAWRAAASLYDALGVPEAAETHEHLTALDQD
jgi:tetratricopeptide (TPR) repeat protein